MYISEVAKKIAKGYLEKHPEDKDDKEFIYRVCQDAADLYDISSSRMSLEAFITNRMHIAMLTAKQRRAKATPKSNDTPRQEPKWANKRKPEREKSEKPVKKAKPKAEEPKKPVKKPEPKVEEPDMTKLEIAAGNIRCPDDAPAEKCESLADILKAIEGVTEKPEDPAKSENASGTEPDNNTNTSNDDISRVEEPSEKKEGIMTSIDEEKFVTEQEDTQVEQTATQSEPTEEPRVLETSSGTRVFVSEKTWANVLADLQAGATKEEVSARYGVKSNSVGYHITKWRKAGLLGGYKPPVAKKTKSNQGTREEINSTCEDLDFVTAHLDISKFLSTLLKDSKVTKTKGSIEENKTKITYRLPNGDIVEVKVELSKTNNTDDTGE